ncbi:hypothetical protein OCUBac02_14800 [Bosea sp. ANAM02]|nr:hypothetical protein OCUBac02_14800 [Bosea sp. ANAM02]
MDFIRQRRLLVGLVAKAMDEGNLPVGSVDLVLLLFGDEPTWAGTCRHAKIVREILEEAQRSGRIAPGKAPLGAAGLAKQAVLNAIVDELDLTEAALRHGRGSETDDVTYREVRTRLDDYVGYLAELTEYHRLALDIRARYALRTENDVDRSGSSAARLREFQKASAWVAELKRTFDQASAVAAEKTASRIRGNPLIDKLGRARWPTGGSRRRARPRAELRDRAVLLARLGLNLDEAHQAALPDGWENVTLSQRRIAHLLPYPRSAHVNEALAAFGHAPWRSQEGLPQQLISLLETSARPCRQALLDDANGSAPTRQLGNWTVSDRWWRALGFYRQARWLAGEIRSGPIWPEPFEYLCAARPEVYSEAGLRLVRQLDAICDIADALAENSQPHWKAVVQQLQDRSPAYSTIVSIALRQSGPDDLVRKLVTIWAGTIDDADLDNLLPGFAE